MGKNKFLGRVPEGWVGCPAMSTGFVDNRFFVFKTPLKHELNVKVPQPERFSIDNVFQQLQTMDNSKIGLWIDLTNTSRYYNASELQGHGIEYRKFQCEGHGATPSNHLVKNFCYLVHDFFRRNQRDYVGVHCTHGFNRTGFLICSYLIRFRRFSPEEAVKEFARFRAPGIYRQIYVDELYAMTFSNQLPLQVTQPYWLQQRIGSRFLPFSANTPTTEQGNIAAESSNIAATSSSSSSSSSCSTSTQSFNNTTPQNGPGGSSSACAFGS